MMKNSVLIFMISILTITGCNSQENYQFSDEESVLDFYRQYSLYTDPGEYTYLYDNLPDSLPELCKLIRSQFIHLYVELPQYSELIPKERWNESLKYPTVKLMLISIDSILISVYYSTQLTNHWIKSIKKNEELKRENLKAQYEALKNQVNPHFLFNSLNTLSGVVEQKPEISTAFIKKLSNIYRYVLEQSEQELVTLEQEIKFVEDYVFLLKMRFGDALLFSNEISSGMNILLPPLGLQMLVENAVKHNIISDDMPLHIKIDIEEKSIYVSHNLQKKKTVMTIKEPQGLMNLKKRYAYLSDSNIELHSSVDDFIVKLAVIEPEENEVPDHRR